MKYKDKYKHLIISILLSAIIYLWKESIVLSFLLVFIFGIVKEIYDQIKKTNTFRESLADIVFNVLGIILGIFIINLII